MVRFAYISLLLAAIIQSTAVVARLPDDGTGQGSRRLGSPEGNSCSPADENPCGNSGNYYCSMHEGLCGEPLEDQEGICTNMNIPFGFCRSRLSWMPKVCGCDGNEYDNICKAHQNGVNILHPASWGSCETTDPTQISLA